MMYRIKRHTKRAVSVLLSLMIVISAVSCLFTGLNAYALEQTDITVLSSAEGLSQSDSVVSGLPTVYFQQTPAEGPEIISMAYPEMLADGMISEASQSEIYRGSAPYTEYNSGYGGSSTELAAVKEFYIDGSERFAQITLTLKTQSDISNILVANHSNPALRNYYYEIFAADTANNLYKRSSLVYTFTNTNNDQIQNFKIAEGKLTGMKYVGMRLYNPIWTEGGIWNSGAIAIGVGNLYPRFYEFNVYGKASADRSGDIITEAGEMSAPTDSSVVKSAELIYNDGTEDTPHSKDASMLYDGDISADFMGKGSWVEGEAGSLTYLDNRSYKIVYTLDGLCDVSKVFVYHHKTQGLMTYKYKIYAAEKKDDLFKEGSLIYDYVNDSFMRGQLYTPDVKANYVAMVITQPSTAVSYSSSSIYPRIMEFNVYGLRNGETDPNAVELLEGSDIPLPTGESVVKSTKVSAFDGTTETTYTNYLADTTNLLDGDITNEYYGPKSFAGGSDNNIEYPQGRYVKIQYELDGLCEIKNIYLVNHPTADWMTQEYKLYASVTESELYNSDSLIYEYTNSGSKQTQLYTLSRKVKYVALVITKPSKATNTTMDNIYPRLMEFDVYGVAEDKFENPTGVLTEYDSKDLPTEGSIVKSTAVSFLKGGTETPRTGSTQALINGSSDDEYYGGNTWASGEVGNITYFDNVELRIKHELYGLSDVTDIWVYNHQTPIMMTYKYKIYMSDDESTLYDKSSLVYDFENTGFKQVQVFSLNKKAKYVAMVITQPSTTTEHAVSDIYPRLREFNVYGTPGVLPAVGVTNYEDTTFPEGNNFLVGMVPSINIYNTDKGISKSVGNDTIPLLNNGTAADDGFYTGFISRDYFADWDTEEGKAILRTDGSVYVDFEYKLGGTATLEKMYIGNHASKDRRIARYALYAATTDSGDLFAEGNLIGTYENDNGVRGQEIAFPTPVAGVRRVGVRILDPFYDKVSNRGWINAENVASGSCSTYTRLNEIAAFGTYEADPFVFRKVLRNGVAALPKDVSLEGLTNLALPFTPRMTFTENGVSSRGSLTNVANLTDGDLKTESENYTRFASWTNGAAQYYLDGTHYFDIYYDLKSEANLKYIVIASNSNNDLAIGKYSVYLSDSKDQVFSDDSLYAEVDNVEALKNGEGVTTNVICFDEALSGESSKGRYVGLRIYSPVANPGKGSAEVTETNNQVYTRIREFSVYGNYTDPTFVPEIISYPDTKGMENLDKLDEIYGKNLLKQENISYMKNGKKHSIGTDKNSENAFWEDNTGAAHYDFPTLTSSESGAPVWIFKLTDYELTNIKGFAYQGVVSPANSAHYASHIRIYVSKEREDLMLPESCVFEYNAEDNGVNMGIFYEFPEGRIPQGAYMAFEFVNPVTSATSWTYLRMSLLHAWGEEAVIEVNPANIAENMPIDAYFKNGDALEKITDKNLTVSEVKALTDGNPDTAAKINAKGKDTLELIYNLCGDINIDVIKLTTLINSNTGFKTVKVYAAESLAKVNDESSLIWTYNAGGNKGKLIPSKTFTNPQKMRYVRLSFQGVKDYLELGEIEIIGLDNQKMTTRNITSSLTAEHINLTLTKKDGASGYIPSAESILEQVIDGDTTSFIQFIKGTVGEDKYDMLIYLDDLRTVSAITTSFVKGFREYRPKLINVYIGETETDVTDPEAEPIYTIDADKVSGDQHTEEIRPMLGRYVRFELADFYFNEYYVDKEGKGVISALLADIKITGTKVKGLQTDEKDDRLLEFTDKKTGINVTINRLDINDIFTDVCSIRVTPETATNWQMRSIQERGSLKIYDKKIYKIELLDLYGNVVTDINGRSMEISFKRPADASDGSTIIGNASERTKITALNTVETTDFVTAEYGWNPDTENKVALLGMVASDDPYWETIGELENFEEGNEDDLKGDGNAEIHDAIWYDSIHTEDGLFTVTPINFRFDSGLEFVAEDISATAPIERYEAVLSQADGKKVAIYYDMKLLKDGEKFDVDGEWVEITMDTAALASDYSDLEIFHVDDTGMVSGLWCETQGTDFIFQTNSFSDFVLVGTALDGSSSIDDGTISDDGLLGSDGTSPSTGEDMRTLYVVLLFMVAAGYVAIRFGKKATNK